MAVQGDEWGSTKDWSALELRSFAFTMQRSIPAKDFINSISQQFEHDSKDILHGV